jgi:hypothetical protein
MITSESEHASGALSNLILADFHSRFDQFDFSRIFYLIIECYNLKHFVPDYAVSMVCLLLMFTRGKQTLDTIISRGDIHVLKK